MTHFCPACWQVVAATATVCPHCQARLAELDQRAFTAKLIAALGHPEPETRQRAAAILGERGERDAVGPLQRLLASTTEPLLATEIVTALGRIGGTEVEAPLLAALEHPAFAVREAAVAALLARGGAAAETARARAAVDPSPSVRRAATS